jgi:hypothetical protein
MHVRLTVSRSGGRNSWKLGEDFNRFLATSH